MKKLHAGFFGRSVFAVLLALSTGLASAGCVTRDCSTWTIDHAPSIPSPRCDTFIPTKRYTVNNYSESVMKIAIFQERDGIEVTVVEPVVVQPNRLYWFDVNHGKTAESCSGTSKFGAPRVIYNGNTSGKYMLSQEYSFFRNPANSHFVFAAESQRLDLNRRYEQRLAAERAARQREIDEADKQQREAVQRARRQRHVEQERKQREEQRLAELRNAQKSVSQPRETAEQREARDDLDAFFERYGR